MQHNDRKIAADGIASMQPVAHGAKPRLRGWSHALAALAALVVTIALLLETHHDLVLFVSLLIFGLTMIVLYSVSAVYHIGTWHGRRYQVLRKLDHANIFLLIAGTYTPISVNILHGWLRITLLVLIWTCAAAGVATLFMRWLPRAISTSLYVGMGWLSLIAVPSLVNALPWQALMLFLAGGILYSMGAIVYALRRPNPLPRVFGFHELFHLFTIAAGAAFVLAIWLWVVPFPRI
jgi:hemolysin III